MARNNFARNRFKVHVLLECEHEQEGTSLFPRYSGETVYCEDCEDFREILVVEQSVYTVDTGW